MRACPARDGDGLKGLVVDLSGVLCDCSGSVARTVGGPAARVAYCRMGILVLRPFDLNVLKLVDRPGEREEVEGEIADLHALFRRLGSTVNADGVVGELLAGGVRGLDWCVAATGGGCDGVRGRTP